MKQYTALQAAHDRLQKKLAEQEKDIEVKIAKIATLEQDLQMLSIGGESNVAEKEHLRKYLDSVIAEIDKNLSALKK